MMSVTTLTLAFVALIISVVASIVAAATIALAVIISGDGFGGRGVW